MVEPSIENGIIFMSKKEVEKWDHLQHGKVTLKAQNLHPETSIPKATQVGFSGILPPGFRRRFLLARGDELGGALRLDKPRFHVLAKQRQSKCLDGFVLLEASAVEFPDEASKADISGKELIEVNTEDLQFFSNLVYLDASDNHCPFEPFGVLLALRELRMACNGIRSISLFSGFPELEVLDLSYNGLDIDSVAALALLPKLRALDLTCNALTGLPRSMLEFAHLETLNLQRNRLQGSGPIVSLASLPRLRELNISYNYFSAISPESIGLGGPLMTNKSSDTPMDEPGWLSGFRGRAAAAATAGMAAGFPFLEWLNLAHNYIQTEHSVVSIVRLERLQHVVLYGNPLARGAAAAEVVDMGVGDREGKLAAAAVAAQETGLYALENAYHGDQQRPVLLNVVRKEPNDRRPRRTGQGSSYINFRIARVHDHMSVLGASSSFRHRKAGGSDRLLDERKLEQKKEEHVPSEQKKQQEEHVPSEERKGPPRRPRKDDKGNASKEESRGNATFITGGDFDDVGDGEEVWGDDLQGEERDLEVPDMIFRRSLIPGGSLGGLSGRGSAGSTGNPAQLRIAINALRYALAHPLTSHELVPEKGERSVNRPTASTTMRQRPRRPQEEILKARTKERESEAIQSRTKSALHSIEHVLDGMNLQLVGDTEPSPPQIALGGLPSIYGAQSATGRARGLAHGGTTLAGMDNLLSMVGQVMDAYETEPVAGRTH